MIRTIVTGVAGRMGQTLVRALHEAPLDFKLCGATEQLSSPAVGQDVGVVAGIGPCRVPIRAALRETLDDALAANGDRADIIVIDFSHPEASIAHARICAERGVGIVIGTTGFDREATCALDTIAKSIPLLVAPNMSVGVVLLQNLVREAARVLGQDYDVEILEMHHRHKKDAPSGTALRLGTIAAEALGRDPATSFRRSREGNIGARSDEEIGLQTLRGGDCVGEHTVFFVGQGERIELTHRAFSRAQFAQGALRAAKFLAGKPAGLYDMGQVLRMTPQ
ncbi:MAG: 4-hydroxy-tetrahydrodipicolinate reductase [Myxococcales bacterium]|jgi:4-hydroxy-tetrahydrodipicolinate reductase|nr:4-hydroxy-tetrahydrodipicolinate reductase [Myxococcales bacterium]